MRKLDEVYAILLTVESSFGITLNAVVYHDGVIVTRANQKLSRLRKSHGVDLISVFFKDFRDPKTLHCAVGDPHPRISNCSVNQE